MNAADTVVATYSTRNMPLLTELEWFYGAGFAINMALLTELSRQSVAR